MDNLTCQLTSTVLVGLDNQAVLHTLNNQNTKPSHHLLDHIHTAIEKLNEKQDKIQNQAIFFNAHHMNNHLIASSWGVVSLKFQWIPGHVDFTLN